VIEQIVALHCRPGSPFEHEDRDLVRAMIKAHLDRDQYVMLDKDGRLQGFMAWIRTTPEGSEMIRAFGFLGLMYLAIPIPQEGPIVVITYDVVVEAGHSLKTVATLYGLVQDRNPDAERLECFLATRRRDVWISRRFHSRRRCDV
jgi:hypothetical protein